MSDSRPRLTYIGGPTALLEYGGLRLLTDPTFDPAGSEYPTPAYVLRKTQGPALAPERVLPLDAVLLSHDHHFDNLDHAGRALLGHAGRVLTTAAGAERLGGNAVGLTPWQATELGGTRGATVRITAAPARHGPAQGDRGPVVGFVLEQEGGGDGALYVSGDTVWYEGVAEVARRFMVCTAVLFLGAARVAVAGDRPLTFTADEAVIATRCFSGAAIVPLHFEGWEHFSEPRSRIEAAFAEAGLTGRLYWPPAGRPLEL